MPIEDQNSIYACDGLVQLHNYGTDEAIPLLANGVTPCEPGETPGVRDMTGKPWRAKEVPGWGSPSERKRDAHLLKPME